MVPRAGTVVANRRAASVELGRVQDRDIEVGVEQHGPRRRATSEPIATRIALDPATTWALVTT